MVLHVPFCGIEEYRGVRTNKKDPAGESAFSEHKSHNSKWDLRSLRYYSCAILTYRKPYQDATKFCAFKSDPFTAPLEKIETVAKKKYGLYSFATDSDPTSDLRKVFRVAEFA